MFFFSNRVVDSKQIQEIALSTNFGNKIIKTETKSGFLLSSNDNDDTVNVEIVVAGRTFTLIRFTWFAERGRVIRQCFNLDSNNTNWYGGPQQRYQYWPIQKLKFNDYSYISKELENAAITERYWLSSLGAFIYVPDDVPLFITQTPATQYEDGNLCMEGKMELPYDTYSDNFKFSYEIGISTDAKQAHLEAIKHILKKPTDYPDERMVRHPIWSTWARYKRDINESIVLEFADEILQYKFNNSQYEIDDDWEVCYGALTFNTNKFPDIKNLTDTLKAKGFRVTLWIHPFINKNCSPWYEQAKASGYLVRDHQNNTDTQWWNSKANESAYVDFTNPEAAKWFSDRLHKLLNESGIDSFKFDAGETSWTPPDPIYRGNQALNPNQITYDYIRTVAKFGPMVEVRAGQSTQDLPIFLRMIDKDSNWDFNNGLPTLITTLLQLNMVGYPFVLPDMIGGNGYDGAPNKEMFIRWLAANVFMPSLQFSYVPWDYDQETIDIALNLTKLHDQYTNVIMERFKLAVEKGDPVNPPIWWVDPDDVIAQGVNDGECRLIYD